LAKKIARESERRKIHDPVTTTKNLG